MKLSRDAWVALAIVAVAWAMSIATYGRLPDPMPIHWNLQGEPDGFCAKPLGPFLAPLIMLGIWGFSAALTRRAATTYPPVAAIVRVVIVGVIGLIHVGSILWLLGWSFSMIGLAQVALGAVLVILGNFTPKMARNRWIGVRTPWTLGDDETWLRTNRFGGRLMVAGGLALIVAGLTGGPPLVLVIVIAALVVLPVVHSYVIYRSLRS